VKQVTITPDIESYIKAVVGNDADLTGFAVFECIAANTRPFTGFRGTLNENATVSYLTLQQMANALQAGDSVPMLWDHDKGSIPVGRAFWGEILSASDGSAELRTLFYVDPTEDDLKVKLDAGSIDEVSISVSTTQMLCSECGWDYLSAEAEPRNLYDRVCANGHEIGTDGVHLSRNGLDRFFELSLVTRGAANGAKIVRRDQQMVSSQITRLAARGFDSDALILRASAAEINTKKDEPQMDLRELNAQLVNAMVEAKTAATELDVLKASHADLQAENARLSTELAAALVQNPDAAAIAASVDFLKDLYTRTLTAAGQAPKADEVPADAEKLVAGIQTYQSVLTALIVPGGISAGLGLEDSNAVKATVNTRAFTGK
jgi:hypothetical protein